MNVTTTEKRKLYYGKSYGEFKARCNNHARFFSHRRNFTDTELSKVHLETK